eukprot:4392345-Pleurochrysis_carterae.AAC.1
MNAARACAGRMRMPAARARVAMRGGRGDGAHAATLVACACTEARICTCCVPTHDGLGRRDRVRARTIRGEAEPARAVASLSHATGALRAHAHAAARARARVLRAHARRVGAKGRRACTQVACGVHAGRVRVHDTRGGAHGRRARMQVARARPVCAYAHAG